jgi:predicted acylesterase/phospholipase RssA
VYPGGGAAALCVRPAAVAGVGGMARLSVALSGGGHRAAVWGAGVALYLADSGRSRDVGAISSVSGGSITNGVIAAEMDFARANPDQVRRWLRPLIRHVAHTGLFFWGPRTNGYVIAVIAALGLGAAALLTGLVLALAGGIGLVSGIVLLAGLVVLAGGLRLFARRSAVVDGALARTHFSRSGRPIRLADVRRSLDHVFCATELQAGDHLYLAPTFLYSYRFGVGVPADLPLSTAVQASACLPGAFGPRRLPTAGHDFRRDPAVTMPADPPADMVLTDGGVYDNMAEQWAAGLDRRLRANPTLPVAAPVLDALIVANASAGLAWQALRPSRLVLGGELAALKRVQSVQYDVSTSHRRQQLVQRWDAAARAGMGLQGALVHIAQSPYEVADVFAAADAAWPARAERARKVIALLGDTDAGRAEWVAHARRSRLVPTVLRRLGPDTTAHLLWHAYVLAACNLHILLDDFPLPAQLPTVADFLVLTGDA